MHNLCNCPNCQTSDCPAAAELEALQAAIKLIEADAIACEQEAAKFKAKNDGINAYLMSTQAMAHRLDLKRLKP